MKKIFRGLKSKSPTILCILAAVGVISTAISAVKAKPKADERLKKAREEKGEKLSKAEVVKAVAPCYISTAVIGASTIVCIFGANALNKKKQAMLTSAYGLVQSNYKRYSNEVKRMFGNEAHNDIVKSMAVEDAKKVDILTYDMCSSRYMSFDDSDENELLFYDAMSKRYFKSTISRVMLAEYHLNRNFALGAAPDKNMFYDFLGIDKTADGDYVGWDYSGGIYWIDFEHIKNITDDGLEYYIINPIFWPEPWETYPTE